MFMAHIGSTEFYIKEECLPIEQFEEYTSLLFDRWDDFIGKSTNLPDYSIALDIEEGSIKGKAKIVAGLGALYIGIGQYGSFISGVSAIQQQIRTAGNYLAKQAQQPFSSRGVKAKVSNNGEALSKLKTLFMLVEQGKISADEAIFRTKSIFGEEIYEAQDFKTALEKSLLETKLAPQQEDLILVDSDGEILEAPIKMRKKPSAPIPKEPEPVIDAFRIEIWRENRRSKKRIKVTSI